jgi:hypothetical protein
MEELEKKGGIVSVTAPLMGQERWRSSPVTVIYRHAIPSPTHPDSQLSFQSPPLIVKLE